MWDGIIIGGGLSGLIAGIRAAERGKKVMLITEGAGSLPFTSGVLNIGDIESLASKPRHPYAIMGEDNIQRAIRYFLQTFPRFKGEWGKYGEVFTPLGEIRQAEIALDRLSVRPLERAEKVVLLLPDGLKDFFPEVFQTNLKKRFSKVEVILKPIRIAAFENWHKAGKSIKSVDYSRFWLSAEGLKELQGILAGLQADLNLINVDEQSSVVIVFPGLSSGLSPGVDRIIEKFPLPVVETTLFPPSASGILFQEELKARFMAFGGEIVDGGKVTGAEIENGICLRVRVAGAGKEVFFAGKSFVLASGGIFGGGIITRPGFINEPVFNLPLFRSNEWTLPDFLGKQPYALTGVEVDSDLHPLDQDGVVVLSNLYVCGRMLAHWDPWIEHCGGGVSLTSGYLTGEKM